MGRFGAFSHEVDAVFELAGIRNRTDYRIISLWVRLEGCRCRDRRRRALLAICFTREEKIVPKCQKLTFSMACCW